MSKVKVVTGPWTSAEESFVRRNMKKMTAKQIASELKRPVGGVVWKKQQLSKNTLKLKKLPKKTLGKFQDDVHTTFRSNPTRESFWSKVKRFFT